MPGGRPTKLTPEVHDALVEAFKAGVYQSHAAAYAGVSASSLDAWRRRAREELDAVESGQRRNIRKSERVFVDLELALEAAEAQVAMSTVAAIRLGGKDWKAKAWFAERRFPRQFGRRQLLEGPGEGGTPVQTQGETTHEIVGGQAVSEAAHELMRRAAREG